MSLTRLRGGTLYDPATGVNAEAGDLFMRDRRLVDAQPGASIDQDFDATGMIVMAGGIDLHSHIGGGKTNFPRLLLPEDHPGRGVGFGAGGESSNGRYLRLASCGVCTPGTLATGYRYAEMGYTAAFEPA